MKKIILLIFICLNSTLLFSQEGNYECVGQWFKPEPVYSLDSDSENLFVGRGRFFEIYDILDSASPKYLNSFLTSSFVRKIKVFVDEEADKKYAVIICEYNSLKILDVTDPDNINIVFNYPGVYQDFILLEEQQLLYVLDSSKLQIMDLSNIYNPSIKYYPGIKGNLINIRNEYIYISSGDYLEIYPIDLPVTGYEPLINYYPEEPSLGYSSVSITSLNFSDSTLYLGKRVNFTTLNHNSIYYDVEKLNISDPEEIAYLGSNFVVWKKAVLKNNLGFISNRANNFEIVDCEQKNILYEFPDSVNVTAISVSNNIAFVAINDKGILVLDSSNPKKTSKITQLNIPQTFYPREDLLIDGNYLYSLNCIMTNYSPRQTLGLRILDVSDPEAPRQISNFDIPEELNEKGHLLKVGDLIYAFGNRKINVINVEDPYNPALIEVVNINGKVLDKGIIGNDLFILTDAEQQLQIWNLNSPSDPKFINSVEVISSAADLTISENYLSVASLNEIQIFRIAHPIEELKILTADFDISTHFIENNILRIIDKTNKKLLTYTFNQLAENVQLISELTLDLYIRENEIEIMNSMVYVHDTNGLFIIDQKDLNYPKLLETIPIWATYKFVLDSDGLVYLNKDYSIYIFKLDSRLTSVNNFVQNKLPTGFALRQNYPNPFNPTTTISYDIPELSKVTIEVYDVLGRKIESLANREMSAGTYTAKFNGANLSSGMYFVSMRAKDYYKVIKMLLIK